MKKLLLMGCTSFIFIFSSFQSLSAAQLSDEIINSRKTVECGANWTYGISGDAAYSKVVSTVCAKSATVITKNGSSASGKINAGSTNAFASTIKGGIEEYYYNIWQ